VYCEENGGKLEIISDSVAGQFGLCRFEDGTAVRNGLI